MTDEQGRRRIAVLGGGCGAMAAVCALTTASDWKERYDITVYQMGWRLGGKGASGRNQRPGRGHRIEEHGLHVWGGFYHHGFGLMRGVYRDLMRRGLRRSDAPLSRLFDRRNGATTPLGVPLAAFWSQHQVVLMDQVPTWDAASNVAGSEWVPWCIGFPSDPFDWLTGRASEQLPGLLTSVAPSGFEYMQSASTFFYQSVRRINNDVWEIPQRIESGRLPAWIREDPVLLERLQQWRAPEAPADPPVKPFDYVAATALGIKTYHLRGSDLEPLREALAKPVEREKGTEPRSIPPDFTVIATLVAILLERLVAAMQPFVITLEEFGIVEGEGEEKDPETYERAARRLLEEHGRDLTLSVALAQNAVEHEQRPLVLPEDATARPPQLLAELVDRMTLVQEFQGAVFLREQLNQLVAGDLELTALNRRRQIVLDLASAVVRGIIEDWLWLFPFESVDHLDFRDWLHRHGASRVTRESEIVMAAYDYTFAYEKGSVGDLGTNSRGSTLDARLAAGTGLKGTLDLVLGYRGAIFWEMQAGMGDAVFAPIYEVLRERGVKFRFFHRVEALRLSSDQRFVEEIEIREQIAVTGGAEYQPLIEVKGLPCWPSEPDYDQLEEGAQLDALFGRSSAGPGLPQFDFDPEYNLESVWNQWDPGRSTHALRRGSDFDEVILGISIGDFPYLCAELISADPRWQEMVQRIGTTATCAMQLWLTATTGQLGWPWPDADWPGCGDAPPILTGFAHRLNTWADLTHLATAAEDWQLDDPPGAPPKSVAYFCGPFEEPHAARRLADPVAHRALQHVARDALALAQFQAQIWVTNHCPTLWRNLQGEADLRARLLPPSVDLTALVKDQYFRANVNPSDLYVQSLPGTTDVRMEAGESGFDNLFLAGDWVRTDLNAGCVEGAVMAGLDAAAAIDGGLPVDPLHLLAFLAGGASAAATVVGEDLSSAALRSSNEATTPPVIAAPRKPSRLSSAPSSRCE